MPLTLKPHEHDNIDSMLQYLNTKQILAFHTNVLSNTLICLFCSFNEVTTFVQKQKCALFSGALITFFFFLKCISMYFLNILFVVL